MGVIERTMPFPGEYISNIFFRSKKNGEIRLILNLRLLNQAVEHIHFKMETINAAIQMISKNCYIASETGD